MYRIVDNPPFADGLFSEQQTAAWEVLKKQLPLGSILTGAIFLQAPFGVLFDAGLGFPVLLEVLAFAKPVGFMQFPKDYPLPGSTVSGVFQGFREADRQLWVT